MRYLRLYKSEHPPVLLKVSQADAHCNQSAMSMWSLTHTGLLRFDKNDLQRIECTVF